jgi:hypothetical protein
MTEQHIPGRQNIRERVNWGKIDNRLAVVQRRNVGNRTARHVKMQSLRLSLPIISRIPSQ